MVSVNPNHQFLLLVVVVKDNLALPELRVSLSAYSLDNSRKINELHLWHGLENSTVPLMALTETPELYRNPPSKATRNTEHGSHVSQAESIPL
ncbi:MAP/microtubule affinity-regulating kinase 3 [Manis javanica]|nr:MAP/microtubule affinity-regulating kinase 3 [Manis javanica]